MKNSINTILFLFLIQIGFSQEVEMITDWNEAKELAQKENKQILIILIGSEWCAPCKKMDKRVIENLEFKEYAEKKLIVFLVDLPGGGLVLNSKVYKDYERFQKKYETKALPSLTLADKNGNKIKTLKGRMFKLKNVLKQLRSE